MKVCFWGVRGSIPSPGPNTVRYGGNTTCIEVRTDDGHLIILDAGTGIFPLSQTLFGEFPLHAHIFNTHPHWDHIQGLPFFIPLFVPNNRATIYGASDPITHNSIDEILSVQLQYRFFPIRECELNAKIDYVSLKEGEKVTLGEVTITPVLLNHPVVNFGYRIDCRGKSMFFTGDYEKPYNIYDPEDDEFDMYQSLLEQNEADFLEQIQGVDVLIADSSYTEAEYPSKKGWGHGTFQSCMKMAEKAQAKRLFLTHHEPTRSDDALEAVFKESLESLTVDVPEIALAREGLSIEW
ncbi:Phosphoribosyl 1,2-cyclic phosphodiesterase [Mariprofundus aestuarium]|uniref:Phosphoribosyl 1,2-cyclic phosphodiesterase n=1 Tax=Mariprofundus aestuarium TaxID=1921086 RepID=A0A2K8KYI5_MARES|nr:MBL fold metallo-hydrolase [Mariprofundus aestuarium]ATX80038.1 Phosphoribosyl 1,2-cyclic phosphodiesterase [Mariprofundus aestuarium]